METLSGSCGRTRDGVVDAFGLASQFLFDGRKRRDVDEDDEVVIDADGRSFRVPKKIKSGSTVGREATAARLCWQVLLTATTSKGSRQTCGGVIIGSRTVLTTGQCVLDVLTRVQIQPAALQVTVGALNDAAPDSNTLDPSGCAQTFSVAAAVIHPQYNDGTNDNDLAVLTLTSPIDIKGKACACALCLKSLQPGVGEKCVVSKFGSGLRTPSPLKWITQMVVSQSNVTVCPVFQDANSGAMTDVKNYLCTLGPVGQELCGDQGSALACFDPKSASHYLAGLVSFGSITCGRGLGGQNINVANYLSWIVQSSIPGDVQSVDGLNVIDLSQSVVSKITDTDRQTTTEACGIPGNGAVDPFGMVSQFSAKASRHRIPGSAVLRGKKRLLASPRIIGGADTKAALICWQVYILADLPDGSGTLTCGGIIIGSRTILSAATCVLDLDLAVIAASGFTVVVGAVDSDSPTTADPTGCSEQFTVQKVSIHPAFLYATNDNDIVLLTLTRAIDLSGKPCACTACLTTRTPATGERCIMSGYGFETSDQTFIRNPIPLKWVNQTIQQQNSATTGTCVSYADAGQKTNVTNFICSSGAIGQDQCVGDGGGPLICYNPTTASYYAAGIISIPTETCGTGGKGQSVKVANYLPWIAANALAGDVLIDSSTAPTVPTVVTTTPTPTTTVPPVTVLPPAGPKQCGRPGNNVADPFGIVGQFSARKSGSHQRFIGGTANKMSKITRFHPEGRIFGGFDAPANEICWQAYLVATLPGNQGAITCGGIIVGSRTILTTASCLLDLDLVPIAAAAIEIEVGALNSDSPASNSQDPSGCAQQFQAQTLVQHPQFVYNTNNNDIAIVTLTQAIDIQNKPCACILCLTDRVPALNEACVMSGFGYETADQTLPRDPIPLKWVQQIIRQQNTATTGSCPTFADTDGTETNVTNFLCTSGPVGQDECVGDNGGPLACYNPSTGSYYAAGIISIQATTCGAGLRSQSVKILNYLPWIAANSLAGDVVIGSSSSTTTPITTTSTETTTTTTEATTTMPTTTETTTQTTTDTTQTTTQTTTDTTTTTIGTTQTTTDTTLTTPGTTTETTVITASTTPMTTAHTATTTDITASTTETTASTTSATLPTTTTTTTTAAPTTTTTTAPSPTCGVPGNGVVDPFGLGAQFNANGGLSRLEAITFFNKTGKIVGGVSALAKEICWQTLVIGQLGGGTQQYCGGVIVGSRTILTAGHCAFTENNSVFSPSKLTVVVGSTTFPANFDTSGCARTLAVSKIIPHPNFNPNNLNNDISVIILENPITFSSCYCPVCVTDKVPLIGEACVISGYGSQTTNDNAPQPNSVNLAWTKQKVRTQTASDCEVLVDPSSGAQTDLTDFICAGGQANEDTCHGDSGGPFSCFNPTTREHYVAGLTSFGTDPCGTTTGSQYTKVSHYLDFITANAPAGDVTIIRTVPTSTTTTTTTTQASTVTTTITSTTKPVTSTTSVTTRAPTTTAMTTTSKVPTTTTLYSGGSAYSFKNSNRRFSSVFG
ncbi:putative Transmembrane protease serine 9 [Hypsibius exemplaris]|uniref:Transmembrane protease serine 9 n=1 Tax=Hypsibius exemplaris TaxID=2072580 RepID=A0A1W0X584_HYPEX|nr:putative Transmembrane protease serine 9 [Hypsibius exemplaris]